MIIFSVHWTLAAPLLLGKAWIRSTRIQIFSINHVEVYGLACSLVQHLNSQPCIGFKKLNMPKSSSFTYMQQSLEKHARRLQPLFYWNKPTPIHLPGDRMGRGFSEWVADQKSAGATTQARKFQQHLQSFIGTFMPSCMGILS